MFRCVAVLSLSALCCGCGDSDGRLPVGGTVKYADGSIPKGETAQIWFEPVAEGRPASGTIEDDGSFTMMTQSPGDGVAPGQYKVVLKVLKDYRRQIPAVPKEYTDASTTPLEATVDDDNVHFDFVVVNP
jgi:hypothetical protein